MLDVHSARARENSGDDAADDQIGYLKDELDKLIETHILLASGFIDVFERVQAAQDDSSMRLDVL